MRDRISSVNSTRKITEAMKLVAAAKVRSGYTGSRATAFAWLTPILKDFCRRISPPIPCGQSPPTMPFNFN